MAMVGPEYQSFSEQHQPAALVPVLERTLRSGRGSFPTIYRGEDYRMIGAANVVLIDVPAGV